MYKKLLFALSIALGIFVLYYIFLSPFISFDTLKASRTQLFEYVQNYYAASVIYYILGYAIIAGLSLPLSAVLTLAGGFLFGFMPGTLYALIGATIGATIAFLASRYLVGSVVQYVFHDQLRTFNQEIEERGAYYLLSMRLLAIIPFFIINTVAGLTQISLKTFVITTIIGILPGCLVYTYAGQSLTTLNSVRDVLSPTIIWAFILLAGLSILPVLWQKVMARST